jgi:hypothetical protein
VKIGANVVDVKIWARFVKIRSYPKESAHRSKDPQKSGI